jgi:hypothetical protein
MGISSPFFQIPAWAELVIKNAASEAAMILNTFSFSFFLAFLLTHRPDLVIHQEQAADNQEGVADSDDKVRPLSDGLGKAAATSCEDQSDTGLEVWY